MDVYLRIDINIVAIALLGAVLLLAYPKLDMQESLNKSYMRVSVIVILELLVETITCIINGIHVPGLVILSYLLHICLFTIGPLLSYNGYVLIKKLVYFNNDRIHKKNRLLKVPLFINTIMVLTSVFSHYLFYIDEANVYHRGKYFIVFSIITYFYLAISLVLVIWKRRKIVKREFLSILLFIIFPTLGGLVQSLFYSALLMWSSTAFALVIIYVFLQERMVHLDDLTGVWTRGSFESYIENRLKHDIDEKTGLIFCDIDDFKSINDEFGHLEGDLAIKETTKIIKSVFRKHDIIARLGGDEFIIVLEVDSRQLLDDIVKKIEEAFRCYNQSSNKKYKLECSFGADILDGSNYSIEQFMHHIDCLMYENKGNKKRSVQPESPQRGEEYRDSDNMFQTKIYK